VARRAMGDEIELAARPSETFGNHGRPFKAHVRAQARRRPGANARSAPHGRARASTVDGLDLPTISSSGKSVGKGS